MLNDSVNFLVVHYATRLASLCVQCGFVFLQYLSFGVLNHSCSFHVGTDVSFCDIRSNPVSVPKSNSTTFTEPPPPPDLIQKQVELAATERVDSTSDPDSDFDEIHTRRNVVCSMYALCLEWFRIILLHTLPCFRRLQNHYSIVTVVYSQAEIIAYVAQ